MTDIRWKPHSVIEDEHGQLECVVCNSRWKHSPTPHHCPGLPIYWNGWNNWPEDIATWRDLGCFDSIDSIAYYTDAQQHQRWQGLSIVNDFDTPFPALAAHNAHVARQIAAATPPLKN